MRRAKLLQAEVLERVERSGSTKVKVAVTDIDGILRGKYLHKEKFLSIVQSGFGFCNVVLGWDAGDVCYDNTRYTGWHSGYPDVAVKLDLGTYRQVPWDGGVPFLLGDFWKDDKTPLAICPRQVLRRVVQRCHDAGFAPATSLEYEWFNFRETAQTMADKGHIKPAPLTPGMFGYSIIRMNQNRPFLNALFDEMAAFDVPIEGLHTETGPGVFEAAILYSDPVEAADRAVLFKTGAKEIGHRFGIMPTFMAKWNAELPGCSGHIHQSLWEKKPGMEESKNLFSDERDPHGMSDVFRSYLAGQMALLPELLPLYAPTVNSYKRLVEGAWAPTRVNWGIDNRTTALRVIAGSAKSTRVETRVNGSDSNPYLALAAALASGLYGVEKKLELPVGPVTGSGYDDQKAEVLPRNLEEATLRLERSERARALLGDDFVEHFVASRKWEWRQFSKAVTDWEMARYFEII
ncbi:MAG TPA: glutamine synthetase family protein [Polyangia bacterium]